MFAVYVDSLVKKVQSCGYGCYVRNICVSIILGLYADDILLLAPSVYSLQQLLYVCDNELQCLDMSINARKSVSMRIGARYKMGCNRITTLNGGDNLGKRSQIPGSPYHCCQ